MHPSKGSGLAMKKSNHRASNIKPPFILLAFLTSAAFAPCTIASEPPPPRLALWITEPIGATRHIQCPHQTAPGMALQLPESQPTLTEHDITAWNTRNGRWTLNAARFAGVEAAQKLQDHCFILAIDNKLIASGVALSSHSERRVKSPTLSVSSQKRGLVLQLTSSFRDGHTRLIHVSSLDAVLGQRASRGCKLQRTTVKDEPKSPAMPAPL